MFLCLLSSRLPLYWRAHNIKITNYFVVDVDLCFYFNGTFFVDLSAPEFVVHMLKIIIPCWLIFPLLRIKRHSLCILNNFGLKWIITTHTCFLVWSAWNCFFPHLFILRCLSIIEGKISAFLHNKKMNIVFNPHISTFLFWLETWDH